MRQKHLLTFSFSLFCHRPSALALALLLRKTKVIREFTQLNWRLHHGVGEGSYVGLATHGGPGGPNKRARAPKAPQ